MKITRWEKLEQAIHEELVKAQMNLPLACHRYYDTKSAGNIIPKQPGDFQTCVRGVTVLVEAKFSSVHKSLRSCFAGSVPGHQLASARIWTRAGAGYIILFYSAMSGLVEIWDGAYLFDCRSKGERLNLDKRRIYDSVEQALRTELGYTLP